MGLSPESTIFVRLYSTRTTGLLGDAISSLALPLAFLAKTGSVTLAATLVAAAQVPQFVLALPLGTVADRVPRKPLVICGCVAEAGALAALSLMLLLGHPGFVGVVCLGAVRGAFGQLGVSAAAGYVPQMLGRDNLLRYHSRVETVEGVATIVGPPVSGGLVGAVGGPLALMFPAGASLINAFVFGFLPAAPRPATHRAHPDCGTDGVIVGTARGIRYALTHRLQFALLLASMALGTTTTSYVFGVVVHLREGLQLSPGWLGVVMACSGLGGLVGSLIVQRVFTVGQGRCVLIGALIVVGAGLVALPHVFSPVLAGCVLFVLDFAWVTCFIFCGTLRQYDVPEDFLARVESINGLAFTLGAAVASGYAALVINSVGVTILLTVVGSSVIVPIAALVAALERDDSAEPPNI